MTERHKTLPSLLRFSLFGDPTPLSSPLTDDQWRQLLAESRQQGVTALAYDAILRLPKELMPPRSVLFNFTTLAKTIEDDNRSREKALCDFAMTEGIPPFVVVKGSTLARHYPCPLHRECGDNDILSGKETETIAALVEKKGIFVDRKDPRHVSFKFEGVSFECHNYLLYHHDDPCWQTEPFHLSCSGNNQTVFNVLTPPFSAFFLAKHTEHHAVFFNQPVRLRDLVDWSLLLSADGFDFECLESISQGTDIGVFSNMMSAYCNKLFGLSLPSTLPAGVETNDFEILYMQCPPRHRSAVVRVTRRSWKYIRYWRKYKIIYGKSMFRRFYLQNLKTALKNHFAL